MAAPSSSTESSTSADLLKGSQVLVQALIRHNVEVIFAYPGGASMPLHQALLKHKNSLRTILPRHEQGGGFAAQGVARSTGKVGVCMATSGPGATNLVTALADAKLDSVPLVAITGQVPQAVIGSDAFQETPTVEGCRQTETHCPQAGTAQPTPGLRKLVELILYFGPLGIGALAAATIGEYGASIFGPLSLFITGVWAAQITMVVIYMILLIGFTRHSPLNFLKQTAPLYATTATTCSSLASLVVSYEMAEERLHLPKHHVPGSGDDD